MISINCLRIVWETPIVHMFLHGAKDHENFSHINLSCSTTEEALMLHVCFRKILYDHNHVARAEMRLIEKEAGERRQQAQAQVRAG